MAAASCWRSCRPAPRPGATSTTLNEKRLGAFWRKLDDQGAHITTIAATRLLLYTMTRKSELLRSKWHEFDLDAAQWDIPAERMKVGKPHRVFLSRQAVELLRQMHEISGHGVFCRGAEVQDMWDQMFQQWRLAGKGVRLLYVGGRGFDLRAQAVMDRFIGSVTSSRCAVEKAELLLVAFSGYQLSDELKDETTANANALEAKFAAIGSEP